MREIEFRGKKINSNKWVYGSLIISKPTIDGKQTCWIKEPSILMMGVKSTPTENFHEVVPETVGQYIGIKDCTKRKIYENDVVELKGFNHKQYIVSFIEGAFCYCHPELTHPVDINLGIDSTGNMQTIVGDVYSTE